MALETPVETPFSPTFPHPHHAQTDSLVSVPLTDSVLSSPLDESTPRHGAHDDDEHMAALLARLEMENNALATDPKAGITTVTGSSHDRNASIGGASLLSLHIPKEALGMSLGDFWAFVTRDYEEALSSMPTMTPIMIHRGVPDFLRPVVWVGIAGARQERLYSEFDRLLAQIESVPPTSDTIIDKDVGRCFPNHPLFAQAGGEGQTMLGQVLKCYNLYDSEIGYCQGMGFIVGILLMKMDARDAFCVFVRLMENHGLRDSYSHSLTGLHSRIFQFQQLLTPLAPKLVAHFKNLGVEFAYLSQWFMTIFATTCPLDTLFRIYDIVLAEGADETVMRVALAVILKNEQKLLAMAELEDVLQLLLSRGIWEPYENNPDQLIEEVTTLFKQVVTRDALDKLGKQFLKQAERGSADKTVRALGFTSTYGNAFRLFDFWSTSKSDSLSPAAPLRRKTSGQSLSTLNSISGSGASMASTDSYASTAPTEVEDLERDSATPTKPRKSFVSQDRNLHEQVEGLLIALSEVQREAAQTAANLQREEARRVRAQEIVADLLELFREKKTVDAYRRQRRTTLPSRIDHEKTREEMTALKRQSNFVRSVTQSIIAGNAAGQDRDAGLHSSLLKLCALFDAETSLDSDSGSENGETPPSQAPLPSEYTVKLENELAKLRQRVAKDRTYRHMKRTSDLKDARLSLKAGEAPSSESIRVRRSLYRRHEKKASRDLSGSFPDITISVPRVRPHQTLPSPRSTTQQHRPGPPLRMIRSQDGTEILAKPQKFGSARKVTDADISREESGSTTPTSSAAVIPKRNSSLTSQTILSTPSHAPPSDETLLVELVAAKTREATAIHEKELLQNSLDKTRRQMEQQKEEMQAKIDAMEAMMIAQMEAHEAEMERMKMLVSRPDTPSSMQGPSPMHTPEMLAPVATGGAGGKASPWGWFGKGRTVSHSPTM
ncbi:RabGAP/TBC, partial [Aureobasidium melanogenum]